MCCVIGQIFGKVRAMFNDRGEAITEAGPATPVEVLGLQGVPEAGESFQVVADVSRAQQISHQRQYAERQRTLIKTTKRGIEALGETEVKELLVVIKADVQGSVEVQYVVDTLGHAEPASWRVMRSTNPQFEAPAREAIMKGVFKPARIKGVAVRQLVQQSIKFTIGQ